MDEKTLIPLLGDDYSFSTLNSVINVVDDKLLLGFWLKTKDIDSEKIKDDLWFWDGFKLKYWKELKKDGHYIEKRTYFDKRISDFLLSRGVKEYLVNLVKCMYIDIPPIKFSKNSNENFHYQYSLYSLNTLIDSLDTDFNLLKNINNMNIIGYISIYIHYTSSLIYKKLKEYIDFDDERYYDLLTFWSMGTYFFEFFNTFPYLFINGVKRSGKTTILKVLEKICFNAIQTGNISASSVFRLADTVRPTLLIDEADALINPKNSESLRLMLLNGYKKGNYIIRTEQRGDRINFDVIKFNVYCPKVLVNIRGIDDVLEDRTIYINIQRTMKKQYSERSTYIDIDESWQEIRDNLYTCLILAWRLVKKEYNEMKNNTKLTNRDWELWKPILVFAKLCNKYNEMVEFAEEKCREKEIEDVVEQRDTLMVKVLLNLVDSGRYYKVSEIKEVFRSELDEDERGFLTARWVGLALKRLGFKNKRRTGGGVEYFLTKSEVENLAKRMGITENEEQEQTEPEEEKTLQQRIEEFILEKCNAENGYSIVKLLQKDVIEKFGDEVYDIAFEIFEKLKESGRLFELDTDVFKTV